VSQALVRTAQDFAAAGCDEPVRWLYAVAQASEADLGALVTIADALPDQTMALRELAVELTQSIADRLRMVVIDGEAAEAADPLLGASLSNLGVRLGDLGRREEALAASQEAVDIRRRLAQSRPDAFLPGLATSISVMSDVLAALGRDGEAAKASTHALEILAPFVERYPQTYGDLARTIGADILRYSDAAGERPDNALLERVARALGGGADTDEAAIEALKAKVDAILDTAGKTGALDEDALAELPSGLAEQLRAAWVAARSASGTENPGVDKTAK